MDKILKTLETIKVPTLSGSEANIPGTIISAVVAAGDSVKTTKKERISHCRSVTDAICLGSVQGLKDYHKILESVVEVLFQLSSDPEADIRMVAAECLNRLVRTLKDSQLPKLHMEIYKEIRRNQNARSLRSALSIFAHISSQIKPQKCRAFFASLLSCFVQISKRTEEFLYENLASYFSDIFRNLGPFAQDQEVKHLCKEYSINLESSSAIIRRASASILVSICQNSKKPHVFLPKLLYQTTALLKPKLMEKSVATIIGSMQCIRHTIPPLYKLMSDPITKSIVDVPSVVLQLVQIYEMCIILCNHDDHNVVTTSLETLQQLLTDIVDPLQIALTASTGIENSLDNYTDGSVPQIRSQTQDADLESLTFDESHELLENDADIPKFRSFLSSTSSDAKDLESDVLMLSRQNSDVVGLEDEATIVEDIDSGSEFLHHSSDDEAQGTKEVLLQTFPEIQIGSLYENNPPVYYCARFLAYNFLLAGKKGYQRPDGEVRISVKVLAVNCLVNLVKIFPKIFFLPLPHDLVETENETVQAIQDVCLYASHNDPLLRGCTYVLAGCVIENLIVQKPSSKLFADSEINSVWLILKNGLLDTSNIGVKCALAAASKCLQRLWKTENIFDTEDLFATTLQVTSNSYWLVKVDLIDLLSNINWNFVNNAINRKKQVLNILLEYLRDEDLRVRKAAITCLPKYIDHSTATCSWSPVRYGILCPQCIINGINAETDDGKYENQQCESCCKPGSDTAYILEVVIERLFSGTSFSDNRNSCIGYQGALACLSDTHPPRRFKSSWHIKNRVNDSGMMLGLYMDILRSSPQIYDMNIHQSVLKITCNLFLASEFYDYMSAKGKPFDEGNPFLSTNASVCIYGTIFMQHLVAVLKLYQNILEQGSYVSGQRKPSTSPVISPVKRLSQKLEAEKKSTESEVDKKAKGPYFSTVLCPIHMRKINESIAQAWKVYRCNLEQSATAKFLSLLITCLDVLGQMFSVIRSDYPAMSVLVEDILSVTNSVFNLCPTESLKCIRKVLHSIFAGHLKQDSSDVISFSEYGTRERFPLFLYPGQLLRFPLDDKASNLSRSSTEISSLGTFIRQFEPAVVAGLRIYTTTSDTKVQVEVLRLLQQLIIGHVNYGLVDANQVFLGFVIKQTTFLEEGQIRDSAKLIEEMFQFLTLLSHEHLATKSFIDIPKILNLCEILISSESESSRGVKCLMPVAFDLIVKRSKYENTNKERKESSEHIDTFLQLVLRSMKHTDCLPILWMLLCGRQQRQESKWIDDSSTILKSLLSSIDNGVLQLDTSLSYNYLVATICAIHKDSLPPLEDLLARLEVVLDEHVLSGDHCSQWACKVSCYWLLLVKLVADADREFLSDSISGSFIIKILKKMVESLVPHFPTMQPANMSLFVQQFGTVVYSSFYILQSDSNEELKSDINSDSSIQDLIVLQEKIKQIPDTEQVLKFCCLDLLFGISFPKSEVIARFFQVGVKPNDDFYATVVTTLLKDLNEGDNSELEEWVMASHPNIVLTSLNTPTGKTFISRLSKFRKTQFLTNIKTTLHSELQDENLLGNILMFLKMVSDEFTLEVAIIAIELMQRLQCPYMEMDTSEFICLVLQQLHTRKLQLAHKDRDIIKDYLQNSSVKIRHPKLYTLAKAVLGESLHLEARQNKSAMSMIAEWCCEDITTIEGQALASMLSSLNYIQIMNVFAQPNFNLRVLQSSFNYLCGLYLMGSNDAKDVISLFNTESRAELISHEKWALGVACVEFVVETLDAWENIISDDLFSDFETERNLEFEFLSKLPIMWECLTAMLRLKNAVISTLEPEDKRCYNNFIPTKIFIISFQYIVMSGDMRVPGKAIPLQLIQRFLTFSSSAFSDSSFVRFFNVRDNPQHIFICVKSLRHIVEQLAKTLRIDWNYCGNNNAEYYEEIEKDSAKVLMDFDNLMDFVFQVRQENIRIDKNIFEPLRNVISGLGRCDLINGWILISHLRWKPQASWTSQIFPPTEPIPLEILRSDHELLLHYIFKLNVFGVASKIQFEENWVIFLSVINLYIDEHFQLQIVSAGLKALSMLLQQCVGIQYDDMSANKDLVHLVSKIDEAMFDFEPPLCKQITFPLLLSSSTKKISNPYNIDVNSCIRFLTDLYTQWLQNPQGKMPLLLLSEVVRSVVILSEYFEENSQFQWMYETLMEIYKSFEKEDEVLWSHLMFGVFYAAAKSELDTEQIANLAQILETSLASPYANVSITSLKCGLVYLQYHPDNLVISAVLGPYVLKFTQLDETSRDTESHSFEVWKILLFIWVHGPNEGFGVIDFEQETIRNILTVLSPINKAFITIRLLVLKALRRKVVGGELKSDMRKKITKVAYETLSTGNLSIFTEALKLYATIFYADFYQFKNLPDPDPEALMPMAERTEILFHLLKSGNKSNNQIVSKVLSLFILDFLPPSEILNRVIAEFTSSSQTAPELLAPVVAQVFEKARRKPKEAALVREWVLASLPNFLKGSDTSRIMWSLTIFFIGVSSTPEVFSLLPYACLRRRTPQIQQLFIHSALDLYGTLDEHRSKEFRDTLSQSVETGTGPNPFGYLSKLLNQADNQKNSWAIDSCSPTP